MFEIERKVKLTPGEYVQLQSEFPPDAQLFSGNITDYFLYKSDYRLLRIRVAPRESWITFKTTVDHQRQEKEIKLPFKFPEFILKGFKHYTKFRKEFDLADGIHICLDETPWGHFMELEKMLPEDGWLAAQAFVLEKKFTKITELFLGEKRDFTYISYSSMLFKGGPEW